MMILINYYHIQAKLLPALPADISPPVGGGPHLLPGRSPPGPRLSPGALGGSQADQNLHWAGQSFICIYISQHLSLSRYLHNTRIVCFPLFFSEGLD